MELDCCFFSDILLMELDCFSYHICYIYVTGFFFVYKYLICSVHVIRFFFPYLKYSIYDTGLFSLSDARFLKLIRLFLKKIKAASFINKVHGCNASVAP